MLPASPLFNGKTWNQLTPAEKEEKKKLDAARNHSIAKEMVTKDLHLQQQQQQQQQREEKVVVNSDGDSDSVSVSSDDIDNRSNDITERFEASQMSQLTQSSTDTIKMASESSVARAQRLFRIMNYMKHHEV